MDSNHRTLSWTDLQSVAFSHSATYPYKILKMPLTRFELVASPLPRECATPAPQRHISETTHPFGVLPPIKDTQSFIRQSPCATKANATRAVREPLLLKKAGNRNRTYNLRFTKPLLYRWAIPATSSMILETKFFVNCIFFIFIKNHLKLKKNLFIRT